MKRAVAVGLMLLSLAYILVAPSPAGAHSTNDWVYVYNPMIDDDGDHNDVSSWWAWGYDVSPPGHHIVYRNYGYANDWSIDIFAKAAGRRFVTPFGSKTNTGHPVQSKVVGITPGCASGNIADGGYRLTIEARDTITGVVLGRADLMHVDRPQVGIGQVVSGWTTLGFTSQFRYSSCYQVSNSNGIHGHVEFINAHRYSCWIPYGYNQALTELTRIGIVGAHYGGQRARC